MLQRIRVCLAPHGHQGRGLVHCPLSISTLCHADKSLTGTHSEEASKFSATNGRQLVSRVIARMDWTRRGAKEPNPRKPDNDPWEGNDRERPFLRRKRQRMTIPREGNDRERPFPEEEMTENDHSLSRTILREENDRERQFTEKEMTQSDNPLRRKWHRATILWEGNDREWPFPEKEITENDHTYAENIGEPGWRPVVVRRIVKASWSGCRRL